MDQAHKYQFGLCKDVLSQGAADVPATNKACGSLAFYLLQLEPFYRDSLLTKHIAV